MYLYFTGMWAYFSALKCVDDKNTHIKHKKSNLSHIHILKPYIEG